MTDWWQMRSMGGNDHLNEPLTAALWRVTLQPPQPPILGDQPLKPNRIEHAEILPSGTPSGRQRGSRALEGDLGLRGKAWTGCSSGAAGWTTHSARAVAGDTRVPTGRIGAG